MLHQIKKNTCSTYNVQKILVEFQTDNKLHNYINTKQELNWVSMRSRWQKIRRPSAVKIFCKYAQPNNPAACNQPSKVNFLYFYDKKEKVCAVLGVESD